MSFSTLMVHLEVGAANDPILMLTSDLAGQFDSSVIGIAACQPLQFNYDCGYISSEMLDQDRVEIEKEFSESGATFRKTFQGSEHRHEWRTSVSLSPSGYVAQQSCAADLIISCPDAGGSMFDSARRVDLGDVVLRAGRPMLVVPTGVDRLPLHSVVVAWSDTRGSRCAIRDALPLLKKAGRVTLVEVANEEDFEDRREQLDDVVAWLKRNGIAADIRLIASTGDDGAQIDAVADELGAGLVVAGAYGHSRAREWVLGGVTRTLLMHPARCSFVSH